jgi:hypothetical protein
LQPSGGQRKDRAPAPSGSLRQNRHAAFAAEAGRDSFGNRAALKAQLIKLADAFGGADFYGVRVHGVFPMQSELLCKFPDALPGNLGYDFGKPVRKSIEIEIVLRNSYFYKIVIKTNLGVYICLYCNEKNDVVFTQKRKKQSIYAPCMSAHEVQTQLFMRHEYAWAGRRDEKKPARGGQSIELGAGRAAAGQPPRRMMNLPLTLREDA